MSVGFTARIFYGCPIGHDEYNKLTDNEKDEYLYWIDCYGDNEDTTFMLGFPVFSCAPGQIKNINNINCNEKGKADISYICNKYNIDTKPIGYYLVNRIACVGRNIYDYI